MSLAVTAQVPGALSTAEVFAAWAERGWEPELVTAEQLTQRVEVVHDRRSGIVTWASENIGEKVVGLLLDAAYLAYRYWFKGHDRPRLIGQSNIAIICDGQELQLLFEPTQDPLQAKTMLAAALMHLMDETNDPDYNPIGELAGRLAWRV